MARKKRISKIEIVGPSVLVDGVEIIGFKQELKGNITLSDAKKLGTLKDNAVEAHQEVVKSVVAMSVLGSPPRKSPTRKVVSRKPRVTKDEIPDATDGS